MQVMETRKNLFGDEHPDSLTSMASLTRTYIRQGRWKEAEKLGAQVVETKKRVLGEEHPYTLTSIIDLSSIYGDQGRWKEGRGAWSASHGSKWWRQERRFSAKNIQIR